MSTSASDAASCSASAPAHVDLHTHSTASDGSRAPSEVVREARRIGLSAIALTDHDTVAGIADAVAAGAAEGVRVVAGVELSAVEADVETHLLGLHLADLAVLERELNAIRDMRRVRAERIVARLNELGVRITMAAVLQQVGDAPGAAIGRPHVARAMVAEGWAADLRDAFDRYLGNGKPAFVQKDRLSMDDAIALIHRAGGLAVLAHPAAAATRERIEALAAIGLDGVEVRHPGHSSEDIKRITALVEHFHMVPSGGSDWHGAASGARTLGMMRVPAEWLRLQDARVAARA